QTGTDMELLCKASTVVFESLSCHKPLKGIYLNLLHIVTKSTSLKPRLPLAGTVSRGSRQHYLPAGVPTGPPQNPPTS
ncbi:hypothetical protein Anapl_13975, partial [Anas platyrhynchos]